jgi:hypothetical protein
MRVLVGLALLAHTLIHSGYLSPAPPRTAGGPDWPFEMSRSWLVSTAGLPADAVRPLGTALVVVTILALAAAGLATIGIGVSQEWWLWLVIVGAVASALTLVLFFHPWIVLGLLIDVVLLYLVLVSGWNPLSTPMPGS